jgi:hypothetical protein
VYTVYLYKVLLSYASFFGNKKLVKPKNTCINKPDITIQNTTGFGGFIELVNVRKNKGYLCNERQQLR